MSKRRKIVIKDSARIVAHIDLDCFYVQVERSHNKSLFNKPVAVVQYNPFGDLKSYAPDDNRIVDTGSLIAVSYEARAKGVKRIMRGAEAKKVCPDLVLVQVPTSHGKADLKIYRDASAEILNVLRNTCPSCVIERASIDEVYLDITNEAAAYMKQHSTEQGFLRSAIETLDSVPTLIAGDDDQEIKMSKAQIRNGHSGTNMMTYGTDDTIDSTDNLADDENDFDFSEGWLKRSDSLWSTEDKLLLCGALLVRNMRKAVFDQLGFTCSGGIAPNKMLAKIASAMHKPNKQTLVPDIVIPKLMAGLPYSRVQGLGGKLGKKMQQVYGDSVKTMADIVAVGRPQLTTVFGSETTDWLLQSAAGIDMEAVQDRALPISLACGKSFRSSNTLYAEHVADGTVLHWLTELAEELSERMMSDIAANSRIPKQLSVGATVKVKPAHPVNALSSAGQEKVKLTGKKNITSVTDNTLEPGLHAIKNNFEGRFDVDEEDSNMAKQLEDGVLNSRVSDWWEEQGFAISKVCPMPINALGNITSKGESNDSSARKPKSTVTTVIAKMALSMLVRAIAEHPRAINKQTKWNITSLYLTATNFQTVETGSSSITSYFRKGYTVSSESTQNVSHATIDQSKNYEQVQSQPRIASADSRKLPKESKSIIYFLNKSTNTDPAVHSHNSTTSASTTSSAIDNLNKTQAEKNRKKKSLLESFFSSVQQSSTNSSSDNTDAPPEKSSEFTQFREDKTQQEDNDNATLLLNKDDSNNEKEQIINTETEKTEKSEYISKCANRDKNSTKVTPAAHLEPQSMLDIDLEVFLTLPADIQKQIVRTMSLRARNSATNKRMNSMLRESASLASSVTSPAATANSKTAKNKRGNSVINQKMPCPDIRKFF